MVACLSGEEESVSPPKRGEKGGGGDSLPFPICWGRKEFPSSRKKKGEKRKKKRGNPWLSPCFLPGTRGEKKKKRKKKEHRIAKEKEGVGRKKRKGGFFFISVVYPGEGERGGKKKKKRKGERGKKLPHHAPLKEGKNVSAWARWGEGGKPSDSFYRWRKEGERGKVTLIKA